MKDNESSNKSTIDEIKENLSNLDDASIERNGRYIYITKNNKRTSLFTEITEETESFSTAKQLFGWILSKSLSCLK